MLAEQYAISRITVVLTYERLIAEGYLETMPAKGTFVSRPSLHQGTGLAERQTPLAPARQPRAWTEAGVGHADPSLFPAVRWRTLIRGALDRIGGRSAPSCRMAVLRRAPASPRGCPRRAGWRLRRTRW